MINYWGIFFTFGIPLIIWLIGIYYAGIEKGEEIGGKTNE